jgi:hypothetical protein
MEGVKAFHGLDAWLDAAKGSAVPRSDLREFTGVAAIPTITSSAKEDQQPFC